MRALIFSVEDFGHHLVRVDTAGLGQVRHEFGAQGLFDAFQDVLLDGFHVQHAHDDFHGEAFRQQGENAAGMVFLDLGQDHGDGLRVFVLEVVGEHLFVHVAELVPHGAAGGAADFFHDHGDAVFIEALQQKALGGGVGADQRTGIGNGVGEVDEQAFHEVGPDGAQVRHDLGKLLDLVVFHHGEELAGLLIPEGEHHDGGLLGASQTAIIFLNARQGGLNQMCDRWPGPSGTSVSGHSRL
jgi:hypothetical protein